jgi:hypothetical protein
VKTFDEIKQYYKEKNLDKGSLEIRFNHYEERRKEKVNILLEVEILLKKIGENIIDRIRKTRVN